MLTRSTADTTKCGPLGEVGTSRRAEPRDLASAATPTAGPLSQAAEESIEGWPTERTMVVANDQTAGPATAADEASDEMWVSEETDTGCHEPAPAVEDDFISEVSPAPAVVAVAVRVTAAASVHRRVTVMATAAALGVVAIVGSLGLAAMVWPATPAEAPSLARTAPRSRDRNPTPAETRVSVTRDATAFTPSPALDALTQSSATPATPAVQATPGSSIAVAPTSAGREGQLRVTSAPSGARVTVNGIGWGQTPLTIDHLPPGMKTVRVTSAGYASQERLVDLRRDRPTALHVTLTSEADY